MSKCDIENSVFLIDEQQYQLKKDVACTKLKTKEKKSHVT